MSFLNSISDVFSNISNSVSVSPKEQTNEGSPRIKRIKTEFALWPLEDQGISNNSSWLPLCLPGDSKKIDLNTECQNKVLRIQKMQGKRVSKETILKIFESIEKHKSEWLEKAAKSKGNLYIPSSPELLRSVQCNTNGSIFIHFNRSECNGRDKLIGKGRFKNVKLAFNYTSGTWFASLAMERVIGEQEIMKSELVKGIDGFVKIESFVTYINKKETEKTRIITQFFEKGDLFESVYASLLNTDQKVKIAKKLLETVSKMHEKGVLHRDLKMENVCLDENLMPIIIDLSSCHLVENEFEVDGVGSVLFLSPEYAKVELFLDEVNTIASVTTTKHEVWALGCLFYIMMTGKPVPWMLKDSWNADSRILYMIATLKEDWLKEPEEKKSINHIIWEMLKIDPQERISAEDAYHKLCGLAI